LEAHVPNAKNNQRKTGTGAAAERVLRRAPGVGNLPLRGKGKKKKAGPSGLLKRLCPEDVTVERKRIASGGHSKAWNCGREGERDVYERFTLVRAVWTDR